MQIFVWVFLLLPLRFCIHYALLVVYMYNAGATYLHPQTHLWV